MPLRAAAPVRARWDAGEPVTPAEAATLNLIQGVLPF